MAGCVLVYGLPERHKLKRQMRDTMVSFWPFVRQYSGQFPRRFLACFCSSVLAYLCTINFSWSGVRMISVVLTHCSAVGMLSLLRSLMGSKEPENCRLDLVH